MGGSVSRLNNKLPFSFDDYVRERQELARDFRDIAKAAAEHRQKKGTLQVINGASGVTAGIAGGIALVLSPVTFGLSVPAAAAVAIVSNSIAAASLTSSVASYGYGHSGDKDIAHRLQNLQCIMESISKKDEEVNRLLISMTKEQVKPVVKACQKLHSIQQDNNTDKRPVAYDLPLSVLKTQGIFLGTQSILQGAKQVKQQDELEKNLTHAADALDDETKAIRTLENQFRYLCCIPPERMRPRGRLTYIDGGGGCSRTMVATFVDGETQTTLKSDSSNVLRLPEGAKSIRIYFQVNGGCTVKQVNRSDPKQPWVKVDDKYQVDVFDLKYGDGVDAVFLVQGTMTHSFVKKAWDFGRRSPWERARTWEWWENAEDECKELLPDLEARIHRRSSSFDEPCGIACGSCFGSSAVLAVEAS